MEIIYWNYKNEAGMRGRRGKLDGVLAAGDRWSECMNRDADSLTQLSAGSKRERDCLPPSEKERWRGDRQRGCSR